jgi:hypothetical protein
VIALRIGARVLSGLDSSRIYSQVLYTKDGQPFLVAGSGTLGWDAVAANLIEPGEKAVSRSVSRRLLFFKGGQELIGLLRVPREKLVLNSGYFGDSFAECLSTYGAEVTQLTAPVGGSPTYVLIIVVASLFQHADKGPGSAVRSRSPKHSKRTSTKC